MDNELFLQHLRDLPLEEGKAYIQEHIEELADHAAIGVLLKDESLPQRNIHRFVSLKLAELLIFFSYPDPSYDLFVFSGHQSCTARITFPSRSFGSLFSLSSTTLVHIS